MIETINAYARILYIFAGMPAFFVGAFALIAVKVRKTHRAWGSIFFWAMVLVAISAIHTIFYHPNIFLFLIAIFNFHLSLKLFRIIEKISK